MCCLKLFVRRLVRCVFSLESLLLTACFLLTWLHVYLHGQQSPNSKLFHYVNTDEAFLRKFATYADSSDQAILDLSKWIELNNVSTPIFSAKGQKKPQLCVAVLFKPRLGANRNYVNQCLMSLLTRVQRKYEDRIYMTIFDVTDEKANHSDLAHLRNLITVQYPEKLNFSSLDRYNVKVKEAADYASILLNLHSRQCEFSLLIEDDGIASSNWFSRITAATDQISSMSQYENKWLCVKLFSSFRFFDWLLHPLTVFISLIWLFVLATAQIFLINLCLSLRRNFSAEPKSRSYLKCHIRLSTFVLISFNSLVVVLWLKGMSVSPLSGPELKKFSQGFNFVAVVYPWSQLVQLAKELENNVRNYVANNGEPFEAKDIAAVQYMRRNELVEFILEPAVFQHIGLHSSLGYRSKMFGQEEQYSVFESYSFTDNGLPIQFDSKFWMT